MLQRLTYFSQRDPAFEGVPSLVERAAEKNRARGVTGLLIADAHCFLQVLEGERDTLSDLFQTISRDPRHCHVVLADIEEITQVSYPDWGMGRLDDVSKIAHMWWNVAAEHPFDPWSMRAREIKDFLRLATFELLGTAQSTKVVQRR